MALTANLRSALELVPDGAERVFATTFQGQAIRYYFTGVAGQHLGLALQGHTQTGGSHTTGIDIRRPDWNHLLDGATSSFACAPAPSAAHSCAANLNRSSNTATHSGLPLTATYSVLIKAPVNSSSITSMGGKLWLSNDLVVGTMALDTDVNIPPLRVGQNARLLFSGTGGQRYGLSISNVSLTPVEPNGPAGTSIWSSAGVMVTVPNGGGLSGATELNNVRSYEWPPMPATDLYTVLVDPLNGSSGTAQMRLWQTLSGVISVDGPSVPLTLIKGQVARYSFAVSNAGQNRGIGISNVAVTPAGATPATISLLRSNGTSVTGVGPNLGLLGTAYMLNGSNLPADTYTLEVVPQNNSTSSSLDLTVSTDVVGELVLNTAYPLSVNRRGQDARLTFSGTAGQNRRLTVTGLTTGPSPTNAAIDVKVTQPNETTQSYSASVNPSSGILNFANLPATGTYTIWFDQPTGLTFNLSATLTQY